jgi:hypothetical protein
VGKRKNDAASTAAPERQTPQPEARRDAKKTKNARPVHFVVAETPPFGLFF